MFSQPSANTLPKSTCARARFASVLALAAALGTFLFAESHVIGPASSQEIAGQAGGCGSTTSKSPCFADNPDILNGQRQLLPNDDIVLSLGESISRDQQRFETRWLYTKDGAISDAAGEQTFETLPCSYEKGVPNSIHTRVGRVFDLGYDVIVNLIPQKTAKGPGCLGTTELFVQDSQNPKNNSILPMGYKTLFTRLALADFDGDSFDDVTVLGHIQHQIYYIATYTAADVKDPARGMVYKEFLSLKADQLPRSDPVTGDFNGDGAKDIAWVGAADGGAMKIYFVSVCPAAGAKVFGKTCAKPFEIIPATHTIGTGYDWKTYTAQGGGGLDLNVYPRFKLAAGQFKPNPAPGEGDQLVVLHRRLSLHNNQGLYFYAYTFDADLKATQAPGNRGFGAQNCFTVADEASFFLDTGRLNWAKTQEQILVQNTCNNETGLLLENLVLGFDDKMVADVITTDPYVNRNAEYSGWGIAIGRFDPKLTSKGTTDFTQQVATLITQFDPDGTHLQIHRVESDFKLVLSQSFEVSDQLLYSNRPRHSSPLQVGDLQGRSLRLGPPTKIKMSGHIQPSMVLGVPPMHVGYMRKSRGDEPSVVNVSVVPTNPHSTAEVKDFSATYNFATSDVTKSTSTSTVGSTASTKESVSGKVSYGVPDIASVSIEFKASLEQTKSNTAETGNSFTTSRDTKERATTGLGDLVWFTPKDFYTYVYPVLGHYVCPLSKPDCTEAEKQPMQVQYSGPDDYESSISEASKVIMVMSGENMEWYQPVHEPGNILTYPWNLSVLKSRFPRNAILATPNPARQTPGESSQTIGSTWSNTQSQSQSVAAKSTNSYSTSLSVAAEAGFDGFGASLKAGLDVSGSKSLATLETGNVTLAENSGIEVGIPALDSSKVWSISAFSYNLSNYIFGQTPPVGSISSAPLEPVSGVSTSGILSAHFTAEATDLNWFDAYNLPDVALNHPARWDWDADTLEISINPPGMGEIPTSRFHAMRGLFVTQPSSEAVTPDLLAASGPNLTVLKPGEPVALLTRVYNTSLAAFEAGTIKVRFFGQEFDGTSPACRKTPQPANCHFIGKSFELGTASLSATDLPPYPSGDMENAATENWKFASQLWNTEPDAGKPAYGCGPLGSKVSCAGKELVFWVLVWAEDTAGKLQAEMVGHGLTKVPSDDLNDITAVPLETVKSEDGSTVSYSNNVGFYNQSYYVCKKADECDETSDAFAATRQKSAAVSLNQIGFDQESALRNDSVGIRASINTSGQPLKPANVFFYDDDPRNSDAMPFDHEYIPFVPSNSSYRTLSRFRPKRCGTRDVHVVVSSAGRAPLHGTASIEVSIDAMKELEKLGAEINDSDLLQRDKAGLLTSVESVRTLISEGKERRAGSLLGDLAKTPERLSQVPAEFTGRLERRVNMIASCL
ncbi:hypothetical protein [Denitrobaculum tricleocarpae]|uniref:VCBS repeat-containing protein n=1 Tax=Denitrobaculum tricleocarpae TaxID=2591009 RepID=A0A545TB51_9PROT|nr:hypothetical protein [Denitrobaculum tricleocarpae]TQV74443.1 hypothetical protein FKG95_24510 [Denitrobaculum tricleocarpae]